MRTRWLSLAILAIFLMPLAVQAQRPDAPPYARRGPYPVGTQEITIPAAETAGVEIGPLEATIWYPALNPEEAEEATRYRVGLFFLPGRALRDAPPDTEHGPYPLVIFSHGSGGLRYQSLYLTEHLASYGFVVLAADHPGNTLLDALRAPADTLTGMIRNFATRPLDILRQIAYLDEVSAADGPLAGLVDMERIAVAGHSFGGYTALAAGGARLDFAALNGWCRDPQLTSLATDLPAPERDRLQLRREVCFVQEAEAQIAALRGFDAPPDGLWPSTTDPRIDAVVLMAPYNAPIFGPAGLAALEVPALVLVGSADTTTYPQRDAYAIYHDIASGERILAVFENASHYLFVDACSEAAIRLGQYSRCSDAVWDMTRAHDLINHLTTAFLLAQLNGDPDAAAALQPAAVDFTGVIYRRESEQ